MASSRLRKTKAGREYYEIRYNKVGAQEHTMRWYVPEGWGERSIKRELAAVTADFERRCIAGEVETHKESNKGGEGGSRSKSCR